MVDVRAGLDLPDIYLIFRAGAASPADCSGGLGRLSSGRCDTAGSTPLPFPGILDPVRLHLQQQVAPKQLYQLPHMQ
jgi:hypothetical protein